MTTLDRDIPKEYRKAVEKQIQKKVLYMDVGYSPWKGVNMYACICPSCNLEILNFDDDDVSEDCGGDVEQMFHSSMVHHGYKGLNAYCNRCGQKLDWGSEKQEGGSGDERL